MDILLAGMNIDSEVMKDLKNKLQMAANALLADREHSSDDTSLGQQILQLLDSKSITPETISAAYARISRDPRPVNQLREEARKRVGKARRSNRTIIFGLGHSSVAEHAVFNLDVIGVSRLLSELLQSHRLCSFTEKSQRYIKLDQDYIVPPELAGTPLADTFRSFTLQRFDDYNKLCKILKEDVGHEEDLCGEDARYVLPLSVTTQMGMTVNARNLEKLLQECASSQLQEYQTFGKRLYDLVDGIAPSLIKYTEGSHLRQVQNEAISAAVQKSRTAEYTFPETNRDDVRLIYATPDGDHIIASALLWNLDESSACLPLHLKNTILDEELLKQIFMAVFIPMKPWDTAPREFESAETMFDLVISAAAYAQMKRHRMATMIPGPYCPGLGILVPPALKDTEGEEILRKAAQEASDLALKIKKISPEAANYAYLSCHRRRLLVKMNVRELIHLSRLREDAHAQWDIRILAQKMIEQARTKLPYCLQLACGKHAFDARKKEYLDNMVL